MAKLKCPKCKSSSIQLLSNTANVKSSKTVTSLSLNPFKPLTHKEKIKKKKSKGKMLLGAVTGGFSLLITGTKDNKPNEYHCLSCGKTWKGK